MNRSGKKEEREEKAKNRRRRRRKKRRITYKTEILFDQLVYNNGIY